MKHLCDRLSLVNQVAVLMLLLGMLGIIGMAITWGVAESIRGNAHAINTSGSLRMQGYRLLSMVPLTKAENVYLDNLERDLHDKELKTAIDEARLQADYLQLQQYWQQTLIPALRAAHRPADAAENVAYFVRQLNALVLSLDHHTEQRLMMVGWIQNIFVALTFFWLLGTVWYLRRRILHPWRQLVSMSKAIGEGDFNQRFHQTSRQDEMASLGAALNTMSAQLSDLYTYLERLVEAKTRDLQNKNQVLAYLYRASRQLHTSAPLSVRLLTVLNELQVLTPLRALQIRVYENDCTEQFSEYSCAPAKTSLAEGLPDNSSLDSSKTDVTVMEPGQTLCWNLLDQAGCYGVILARLPEQKKLTDEQQQLIHTLTEQITSILALERQTEQQQRLLVMEERAVIARELHDSIAQSLSCLKLQISYLQRQSVDLPDKTRDLLQEMREEINSAYSKLRELLITFRLRLNQPGLLAALQTTIEEFNQRLGFAIQFDYQLPVNTITAHQAIHLTQITREALTNILKHASASVVNIHVIPGDDGHLLIINDNGCGIRDNPERHNHYGLTIMADRARSLNGEFTITRREQGGTQICVQFPQQAH